MKDESYEKIFVIRGLSPHGLRKFIVNVFTFYIMGYAYLLIRTILLQFNNHLI
jgi:hypothetical protein